ncbi:MAG TPA: PD-(D/E)XK nuclease family protein, partial [bacterium]|nr:PD-(D/E)XK nuclease family protein [bacterium]
MYFNQEIRLTKSHFDAIEKCPLSYKYKFIDKAQQSKLAIAKKKESAVFDYLGLYNIIENFVFDFHKNIEFNKITKKSDIDISFAYESLIRSSDIENIDSDEPHIYAARKMVENYFYKLIPDDLTDIIVKEFLTLTIKKYKISALINRIIYKKDYVKLSFLKIGKIPENKEYLKNDIRFIVSVLAAEQNKQYKNKKIIVSFLFLDSAEEIEFISSPNENLIFERRIKEDIYNISILENSANKNAEIVDINKNYIFHGPKLYSEQVNEPQKLAKITGWCPYCDYYGNCAVWRIKPFSYINENLETYNNRIKLSYSKYSGFKNCQYSWKLRYIDKIPSAPQPFFDLGHSVHETFEKFYNEFDKTPRTLEYLLTIYDRIFEKFQSGYQNADEKKRYYDKGKQMLINYYNRFVGDPKNFKPAHSMEAYFELPLGNNVIMNGYIDRIDKLDDGSFEILDYKTEPTDRTQEDIDSDDQLSIYYWAAQRVFGMKIKQVSLFMLE